MTSETLRKEGVCFELSNAVYIRKVEASQFSIFPFNTVREFFFIITYLE